jgi:hypothetical protein
MAKKNYHNIGSMKTKKDKDEDGNVQYVIQLDKKYHGKIFIKNDQGKLEPVTEYISVERPTVKYDRMLKKGTIDEKEYEEKVDQFDSTVDPKTKQPRGKLSFIKFDLQMVTEE